MIDGLTAGVRYTVTLNVILYVPYNLNNVNTFITECGLTTPQSTLGRNCSYACPDQGCKIIQHQHLSFATLLPSTLQ